MAVTEAGTPNTPSVSSGTNTPSVSPSWAAGQTRTAGNFLVCAVTNWGGTTGGTPGTPSGWTQLLTITGSSRSVVTFFGKYAAGSDAAPAISATNTGTATFSTLAAQLHEYAGVDGTTAVGASGTATGTTANPLVITTSGNVPASGCFALSAASVAINAQGTSTLGAGSGWTDVADNGSTSTRAHWLFGSQAGPTSGSTLSESVSYTGTGSFLAGAIIVIQPVSGTSGSAALTGQGTLGASPYFDATPAGMSGSGTLTASGIQLAAAAGLSGTGTLAGLPQLRAAAALSGSGTLSAAPYFAGAAALSGLGTLTTPWTVSRLAALSGLGTLTTAPYFQAAGGLSGLGTLSGAPYRAGTAGLSGLGTLSAAPIYSTLANLSGLGVLGSTPAFSGSAGLSGLGTLTGVPSGGGSGGSAALTGLGTLSAAGYLASPAALAGLGTLTGGAQLLGAAALSGLGTLAGLPSLRPVAALSGQGSLAAAPYLTAPASLTGTGTLIAAVSIRPVALLSGQGTLTAGYLLSYQATAALSGVGTLTGSWTLVVPGDTGTVPWIAAPAADRWIAVPAPPRWLARLLAPRWQAVPHIPRWTAAPAPPRWEIIMAAFAPISALSLEEINITWTSDLDGTVIVPTSLTVQFAVPVSSGNLAAPAQPVTWLPASWLANGTGKGFVAQGLVGPGGAVTLAAGQKYDVWGKILGSPEQPVKFAGVQPVY